ncbi:MAG TPA: P-type conjugative transfer protein TrbG [Sphingomonas sp.]|nr:P-type conjugative transfer protein TrbG [Sphingomonas sp.]
MKRHCILPLLLSTATAFLVPAGALAQTPGAAGPAHRTTATIAAANRAATLEPSPPTFLNATAVMPYAEGTIYQVTTTPERVTDIVLEPGEVLGAVASGDTARWVIGDTTSGAGAGKRVHILVKPYAAGLSTNLVITTDRRTYHIALASVRSVGMSALTWTYPQDALLAIKRSEEAAAAAAPVAAGLDVDQLYFNYAISGDTPRWRPLRAFDDGRQTYIEFPASLAVGEAPPLFLVGAKGEAQLVNYRLRGRYYVVDRLFDVAELRLGTKHQEVVRLTRTNEAGRRGRAKGRAS